ncbi:MAG: R3H domain-containing nucleic acid-binding protein [Candidatus Paceibacterota bacterium]
MSNTETTLQEIKDIIEKLVYTMGFRDVSISLYEEGRRFSIFINDASFLDRYLSSFVSDLDYVLKMILKKKGCEFVFIDINNHRKEREDLLIKLARAAAKKVSITKKEIILPAMNAFERRIIHAELATNPDIKTESVGEGRDRKVVVQPLE